MPIHYYSNITSKMLTFADGSAELHAASDMVLLLGACPEYGCLVYEYMDYGSLEDRLCRRGKTLPIPWSVRFRIAADVATGLLFLLDHNFVSKISDVGLARLLVPQSAAPRTRSAG